MECLIRTLIDQMLSRLKSSARLFFPLLLLFISESEHSFVTRERLCLKSAFVKWFHISILLSEVIIHLHSELMLLYVLTIFMKIIIRGNQSVISEGGCAYISGGMLELLLAYLLRYIFGIAFIPEVGLVRLNDQPHSFKPQVNVIRRKAAVQCLLHSRLLLNRSYHWVCSHLLTAGIETVVYLACFAWACALELAASHVRIRVYGTTDCRFDKIHSICQAHVDYI